MSLGEAFDRSLTALARWRSGDADVDAVVEALEALTLAVAGTDAVLAIRYDRVFSSGGDDEDQ